jgi:cytochrome c-type biogenesis protein CcmH
MKPILLMKRLFAGLLLCAGAVVGSIAVPVMAASSAPAAAPADPLLEKRVMVLSDQLRCLVCQNQTIADSNADLAIDLRNQVRSKLKSGWSDGQVLDYMVQRYGDFVLYKPPVKVTTWLLWFGPFVLFAGALLFLRYRLKHQPLAEEPSADALQRAQQLLDARSEADGRMEKQSNSSKDVT